MLAREPFAIENVTFQLRRLLAQQLGPSIPKPLDFVTFDPSATFVALQTILDRTHRDLAYLVQEESDLSAELDRLEQLSRQVLTAADEGQPIGLQHYTDVWYVKTFDTFLIYTAAHPSRWPTVKPPLLPPLPPSTSSYPRPPHRDPTDVRYRSRTSAASVDLVLESAQRTQSATTDLPNGFAKHRLLTSQGYDRSEPSDRPNPVLEPAVALDGSAGVPSDSEDRASDQDGKTGATASAQAAPATSIENPIEMEEVPSSEYTDLDLVHPPPLPLPPSLLESLDALPVSLPPLPPSPSSSTQSSSSELAVKEQTHGARVDRKALMAPPEKPTDTTPVPDPVAKAATPCHHLFEWAAPQPYEDGKWPKRFLAGRPEGGLRQRESSYRRLASKNSRRVVKTPAAVYRPTKVDTASNAEPLVSLPAPDAIAGHPISTGLPNPSVSSVSPANVCLPPSPDVIATPDAGDCQPEFMDIESHPEPHEIVDQLNLPMVTPAVELPDIPLSQPTPFLFGAEALVNSNPAEFDFDMGDIDVGLMPPELPLLPDIPDADLDALVEQINNGNWTEFEQANAATWSALLADPFIDASFGADMVAQLDLAFPEPEMATDLAPQPAWEQETPAFDVNLPLFEPQLAQTPLPFEADHPFAMMLAEWHQENGTVNFEVADASGLAPAPGVPVVQAPADMANPFPAPAATEQIPFPSAADDPWLPVAGESTSAAGEVVTPLSPGPMLHDPYLEAMWTTSFPIDPLIDTAPAVLPTVTGGLSPAVDNVEGRYPASTSKSKPEPLPNSLPAGDEAQSGASQPPTTAASCLDQAKEVPKAVPAKVDADSSARPSRKQNSKGKGKVKDKDTPAAKAEVSQPEKSSAIAGRIIKKACPKWRRAAGPLKPSPVAGEGSSGGTSKPVSAVPAPTPTSHDGKAGAPNSESPASSANDGNDEPLVEDDNLEQPLFAPIPLEIANAALAAASAIPNFAQHNRICDDRLVLMLIDPTVQEYLGKLDKVVDVGSFQLELEDGVDESLPEQWSGAARDEMAFILDPKWESFDTDWDSSGSILKELATAWLDAVTAWPEISRFNPEALRSSLLAALVDEGLLL
ncbi:uncharacterized protein SPSK_04863 [Sporothrix schenckii 1099-18]|uniref:Uncharacterized protein n=1 Tax=Sporothrix schenckii 1099-18 TaxID=1397361 RepID=A0A0F2LVG5_SPOSC|nr:uncharacterized protein SPSK_04863 [Sporothrix schenckii 1099-18]KJR80480.1 hypothetical protein SPSK_04863 [Sporothrix schenckii 1099-18]